jgi:hypothetical protein
MEKPRPNIVLILLGGSVNFKDITTIQGLCILTGKYYKFPTKLIHNIGGNFVSS